MSQQVSLLPPFLPLRLFFTLYPQFGSRGLLITFLINSKSFQGLCDPASSFLSDPFCPVPSLTAFQFSPLTPGPSLFVGYSSPDFCILTPSISYQLSPHQMAFPSVPFIILSSFIFLYFNYSILCFIGNCVLSSFPNLNRGQQTFLVRGQIVNTLGFGEPYCVMTARFCRCHMKEAVDDTEWTDKFYNPYLWTLKFEFSIIFMSDETFFFWFFPTT